jgi:lipopolysaccharide transport system ATP-binding protein
MRPIIQVENLGKKYTIHHQGGSGAGYRRLSEDLAAAIKRPFRRRKSEVRDQRSEIRSATSDVCPPPSALRPPFSESFWALRDVSFDVQPGEVLGIIGRNGAGKSTLLKILSRITEPTEGRVTLRGRVASLLEVGTGFHPELTGRENVYLNGAVLGMSRAEIKRKFDEIVAFAEVEKFLDTPVKHYSSGMYVRLAFAVAAHLEPEILVVDEVLAVGDAEFQKKCLGKMGEVAQGGRTVLFVSHNMNAVESLCRRVAYLDHGRLVEETNDVRQVITRYLAVGSDAEIGSEWCNPGGALNNPWFYPTRFYLGDSSGQTVEMPVRNDKPIYVYVEGEVDKEEIALNVGYGLYSESGSLLFWSAATDVTENQWPKLTRGGNRLRSPIPVRLLNQGVYRLDLLVALYHRQWISCPGDGGPAIRLSIQGGLSDSPYWIERRPGVLAPVCQWTNEKPQCDASKSTKLESR